VMLTNDGVARCVWEPRGEDYDCSQLWPTTTAVIIPPGCCRGSTYKAQSKCIGVSEQSKCDRSTQCEWILTEDPNDCVITTATPTEESGCCAGETATKAKMCEAKESRDKCERGKGCLWKEGEDADCSFTPTEPAPGCCAGTSALANDKCSQKTTQESCDRMSKCMWEEGEDADCSWPTTTEQPWFGAKPMSKQSKKQRSSRHGEQALYGADTGSVGSVISEQMEATVSLSTLLLLALVGFAVRQLYRCWSNNDDGDKMDETVEREVRGYYQSV